MQVTVTGKQMDVGDSLRSHAETATTAIADKYLGRAIEVHVVFCHERHLFLSDISLHAWRGLTVQCHGEAADAYAAFDDAALRLEKQLRRYKRRLRGRHKGGKAGEEAGPAPEPATDYVLAPEPPEDDGANEGSHEPLIVAEMRTSIPHLSVSEAVMRLDLADLPALLFRNSAHGNLNLVYRRRDGNIGWIDPDLAGGGSRGERGTTS
ncbi:MAG TPA: ribosome-associated translation inhibitor RaiA [Stellaceae bacterium]|nr:ribosome-associated translation inhibitor RaiA [Stellaceae bacterium]